MKIFFINSIPANEIGGGEKWMLTAAKGLMALGHSVAIITRPNSLFHKAATIEGVKVYSINIRGDLDPASTWQLYQLFKIHQPAVLICNFNKDVRVAGLAAKLAKGPVVLARHGLKLSPRKTRHRLTLRHLCDGIITNSQAIKDRYLSYGWFHENFIHLLYNGVAVTSDIPPYDFSQHHPNRKIILGAGRLTDQKGFDILIGAAALLKEIRQDFCVAILGEGPRRTQLEALIRKLGVSDIVSLLGYANPALPYIKGADVFALSSRYEGMPNVVMEAMALGTPVVATSVDGVNELIENEKSGLLVSSEESEEMAMTLNGLLNKPAFAKQLSQNAQARINQHFTIPKMIKKLQSILEGKVNAYPQES